MSIRLKLPLAFVLALVVMATVGLIAVSLMRSAVNTLSIDVQRNYASEVAIVDLAVVFKGQVQEWKDTLLRGKDPAKLTQYWGNFQSKERDVHERAAALLDSLPEGKSRKLVAQFAEAHQAMGLAYRKGFEAFEAAGHEAAAGDAAVAGMDRAPTQLLLEATKDVKADAQASYDAAQAQSHQATTLSWIGIVITTLIGAVVGYIFSRAIVREVDVAKTFAARIAGGDLSQGAEIKGRDELAQLKQVLEDMRSSLAGVVRQVREGSESVATASAEIAQGNQDLSSRTEAQASALEQTTASMEHLGSTVRSNAENAQTANQLAQSASDVATQGGTVVSEVVETMRGLHQASSRIADIIGVIDGIAFQTNILALNAAVEAARAGEQGRGFAVVASEVRSLASRSSTAAKEIKTLIDDSVERVAKGTTLADRAGATMNDIVASIKRVTDVVGEISSASNEQSAGVVQVGQAVKEMDQATQQNAAMVEQMAAAASSLSSQANNLVQSVSSFKLADRA